MTVGTHDEMVMVDKSGAAGAEVAAPDAGELAAGVTYDGLKVEAAGTAGTAGAELLTKATLETTAGALGATAG